MKILEYMSFNPSWFTTVPGILITGGVVLLLIALIILLTSGNSKKEEEVVETNTNSLENNFNNVQEPVQVVVPEAPVMQSVVDIPAQPVEESMVAPTVEIFEPTVSVEPVVATPIVEEPIVQPQMGENLNVSQPVSEVSIPVEIQQEPKLQFDIPKVEPVIVPNVIEQTPIQQPVQPTPAVSIYGGASPTVNLYNAEPVKPVIYGGADPLENTGSIPKVEMPTVTPVEEVKVVEPIVPEPVVTPTAVVENQSVGIIPDTSVNEPTIQNISTQVEEIETLDF